MKKVHFTAPYLLEPTNPVTVNLIGCGGNGSGMIQALAKLNYCLLQLDHPGLHVRVFDGDTVSAANIGRQGFIDDEIGMNKALALVSRYNRIFGSAWEAYDYHYSKNNLYRMKKEVRANIIIACVDKVDARFEIVELVKWSNDNGSRHRDKGYYYMDLGNTRFTGQFMLSTIQPVQQPDSSYYSPVDRLPFITELYGDLLRTSEKEDQGPSCSVQAALRQQDLFVNPVLSNWAGRFLWKLFTEGKTFSYGMVVNLDTEISQPLMIDTLPEQFIKPTFFFCGIGITAGGA